MHLGTCEASWAARAGDYCAACGCIYATMRDPQCRGCLRSGVAGSLLHYGLLVFAEPALAHRACALLCCALQEAVEGLITAFLLPSKDLRTLQTVRQRVGQYGGGGGAAAGGKNPLLASLAHGPSMLARTSTNPDLIRAINPLAGAWTQGGRGWGCNTADCGARPVRRVVFACGHVVAEERAWQLPLRREAGGGAGPAPT